jgi:antirestriction protein ArdC
MSASTRTSDVLDRLTAGIGQLTSSTAWKDWLTVQSRFHRYSFGNTLLILSQTDGQATRVAGYHAWRKLGRNVRKGEQAIWILAPMTRRVETDDAEEPGRVLSGFKAAAVFDIEQTDGEPLPEIATRLQGDDPLGSYDLLREAADSLGYTVKAEQLPGEINGDCNVNTRTIRVECRNDGRQQVKTLAHELGHAVLHDGFDGTREVAELEAESVAFIVCATLGISTDEYSFGYVAIWSGGGDEAIAAIKTSGSRIQTAAETILAKLEAVNTGVASQAIA